MGSIRVDFEGVQRIDVLGLWTLLAAGNTLAAKKLRPLEVVNLPPALAKIFKALGLEEQFSVQ